MNEEIDELIDNLTKMRKAGLDKRYNDWLLRLHTIHRDPQQLTELKPMRIVSSMNEKIKELIKLSYVEVPHERIWDAMSSVFDKEKFAELIIQECINVISQNSDPFVATPYSREIKEHFGIKNERKTY
jgi:hypothetical protein